MSTVMYNSVRPNKSASSQSEISIYSDVLMPITLASAIFEPKVGCLGKPVPTFGHKVQQQPRRKQSICKWLRDRTSGIDIGVEIEDDDGKHPIHLNNNAKVLDHFELLRNGERSFLKRISNMNFIDHFTDVATFYFAGAAEARKLETLVLIDIDCKKTNLIGSLTASPMTVASLGSLTCSTGKSKREKAEFLLKAQPKLFGCLIIGYQIRKGPLKELTKAAQYSRKSNSECYEVLRPYQVLFYVNTRQPFTGRLP